MVIPRVKGKRREVRRMLAQRSKELLARSRRGDTVGNECPLKRALAGRDQLAKQLAGCDGHLSRLR
jgi:hypothetical protein